MEVNMFDGKNFHKILQLLLDVISPRKELVI